MDKELKFENIPYGYSVCFNGDCALRETCMHYLAGQLQPANRYSGHAIYPMAWKSGTCQSYREKKLAGVLDALAAPLDLKSDEEYKYLKKRTRQMFTNATDARKGCGVSLPGGTDVAGLFGPRATSLKRLSVVRSFDPTVQAQTCRLLFNIKSRIVVNDGSNTALSGGQRAEYLLLHRIAGAVGKDVVLIDEPESSFDNPFLNHDVITLLNDVAEHATVFLVTHNNTLGVSLLPDRIIYTEKTEAGEYRVYSGELSATKLIDAYGNERDRKEVMLDTMEAGRIAYLDRRIHYGLVEDK